MKQTNEKYINKEMAMMAALTTESMLLHDNYDAMLYWNEISQYYCILIEYNEESPNEKYPNYECSRLEERILEPKLENELLLKFEY